VLKDGSASPVTHPPKIFKKKIPPFFFNMKIYQSKKPYEKNMLFTTKPLRDKAQIKIIKNLINRLSTPTLSSSGR
jgi:hypothetical protein